ncbi:MAG: hypothetical protein GOMPHAMPRED_000402 [Gomphillus americanus]|uniref:NAD(P)-binding protein n=1 Tax=Gomphillus americanus TaxID=1940652 RepID=A0A8H3EE48_9LECA|nr:MAG: hypothetical protein GOMPHAMPRED_000402 [Gomphillus americanus]
MSIPYVRHFFASQFLTLPELTSLSFEGQTVVVTGANTGLGFECARHFHTLGADLVILAVRDVRKGESARDKLLVPGRGAIEVWQLDLSDTASVIAFAEKAANHPRIDVVLENAGMQQHRWQVSKEGFEMTVAVNFYGTILLALLLIPILRRSGQKYKTNPRLTVVTSEVHHFTSWGQKAEPLTDLNDESKFVASDRYNVSKLLEVLYIRELAQHVDTNNGGPILNLANPGLCVSDFDRNLSRATQMIIGFFRSLLARTTEAGARTLVWPTSCSIEGHGQYSLDCTFNEKALSRFVRSDAGIQLRKRVFAEANAQLELLKPNALKLALSSE